MVGDAWVGFSSKRLRTSDLINRFHLVRFVTSLRHLDEFWNSGQDARGGGGVGACHMVGDAWVGFSSKRLRTSDLINRFHLVRFVTSLRHLDEFWNSGQDARGVGVLGHATW